MARTLKSKRGGGFFNFFTKKKVAPTPSLASAPKKSFFSRFTRKNVQPVETVNPAFALAQTPKTSKSFFSRFSRKKTPNNVKTTNPLSILKDRRYESVQEGVERSMSFAFQKLDGGQVDPEKLSLSPEEKKILQVRILSTVREGGEYFGNNETQNEMDVFCQTLFGQSMSSFDKELRAWENYHPNPMIIPFAATSGFARLIGLILDTDRERQHFTNTDAQACIGNSNGSEKRSLSAKTLNTDTCMVITNTPDSLGNAMDTGDTFYIVINPKFWTRGASGRYQSKYYKINKPTFATIQTKYALVNSSIQDAFLNKGLILIEPRLGFLFQKEAPELWNRHYWLPKFSTNPALVHNYNNQSNVRNNNGSRMYLNEAIVNDIRKPDSVKDVLRIVLLTLQKYSSLRRFAYTKNPDLCSQIYSDYYVNNAVELLRPDIALPVSDGDLPDSKYTFNRQEFDTEFVNNQRWANPKGIALFKSFDDPRLQVFFKTNPAKLANPTAYGFMWLKPRYKKRFMQVPIDPLPNVEAMVNQASMAFRSNQAMPYTNMNQLHNLLPPMNASHNIYPSTVRYR